ncbi:MAG TPA: hypothetical protein VGE66_20880 [Chitinophagaceae bacterium]
MERFNRNIMVGAESRCFHFTRMKNREGVKSFITTVDERKKPVSFSMKKNNRGDWSLTPGSLRWLYDIEFARAAAIIETRTH